jgi:hypothetical protein
MWQKFHDVWNKSVYFRGAVVVFAVGVIMIFNGGGGAASSATK